MESITYLIQRELLARRAIALPYIGMIECQRVAASFAIDRSHLIPPRTRLTLTPNSEQDGASLIEMIADESAISPSEAVESYNDWINSSTDEQQSVLIIEEVCSIDLSSYTIIKIDAQFAGYLSPMGEEPVAIGRPLDSIKQEQSNESNKSKFEQSEQERFSPSLDSSSRFSPRQTSGQSPRRSPLRTTSSAALILSIIALAVAALYVAYFYLSKYGILTI